MNTYPPLHNEDPLTLKFRSNKIMAKNRKKLPRHLLRELKWKLETIIWGAFLQEEVKNLGCIGHGAYIFVFIIPKGYKNCGRSTNFRGVTYYLNQPKIHNKSNSHHILGLPHSYLPYLAIFSPYRKGVHWYSRIYYST